jgi:CBS domain containing-hemolysin-like protein
MNAVIWLLLNILSIIMLAFYSMMEMACVSFNKVRLQYYVSKGMRRALWLNYLLQHPSRLFGTTLIGVNVAMFFGSEFSREFHSSLGINPDWSPLSQVILVVIFGELSPMFAARRYAEHVTMIGIPVLYFSARLMTPLLIIVDTISKLCEWVVGKKGSSHEYYLTQDELKKIIEEKDEDEGYSSEAEEFNIITSNIFNLGQKIAKDVMDPIRKDWMLPGSITVGQFRKQYALKKFPYCYLYHKDPRNIVGLAFPRELIRVPDGKKVRDYSQAPWFVTEHTKVTDILKQFRKNNQEVSIIVNQKGHAVGVYDLKDVLDEIFGESKVLNGEEDVTPLSFKMIDKTLPAEYTVGEFAEQFGYMLDDDPDETLGELVQKELGHLADEEESVYVGPYELTVKEVTLRGIKSVQVKSKRG